MKIVIINGAAECGKDSLVKIVKNACKFCVYNISTVDPVKDATDALGISREPKDDIIRKFWSDLKDMWTEHYDGPFRYVKASIRVARITKKEHESVCFVHSREPEEITRFKEEYPDCTTLLVRRPGYTLDTNHADANVEKYSYDMYLDNNGSLEDWEEKVNSFIKEILE